MEGTLQKGGKGARPLEFARVSSHLLADANMEGAL